jgi:hypothetical protein
MSTSSVSGGCGFYQSFKTVPGNKYTVQFKAMIDINQNNDTAIGIAGLWEVSIKDKTSLNKYTYTFTADKDSYNFLVYSINANTAFYIDDIKVEDGENVTAWSPNANEAKGTHYILDGDSFKIGDNLGGDTAEHSPSYSKWKHSDGTYTQADANGLKHYNASTNTNYHYLLYAGSGITNTTGSETWVQLPDEFKGKTFQITVSAKSIKPQPSQAIDSYCGVFSFRCFVNQIDIANGKFSIWCDWDVKSARDLGIYTNQYCMEFSYVAVA